MSRRPTTHRPPVHDRPAPTMIVAYVDGGSRGNPGPAGYGARIEDADGELIEELWGSLGRATNNVAEYEGLIAALTFCATHGHRRVTVRSDSQLLVRQMRGEYRVRNEGLRPLFQSATALVRRIGSVEFEHVPREQNTEADRLANMAMDEAT